MKQVAALAAAVCGLCAQVGSGASASLRTGQPGGSLLTPAYVTNIGTVMSGQNMLEFDLWSTVGSMAKVFEARYSGKETPDKQYFVPDGYDITHTTACQSSVTTQKVAGETSLMKAQTAQVKFDTSVGYGEVSGSLQNNDLFKQESKLMSTSDSFLQVSSLICELYQVNYNSYVPPDLTQNFAEALWTLHLALPAGEERPAAPPCRSGEVPSWCTHKECRSVFLGGAGCSQTPDRAALAFLGQFGTHYMLSGSMGSAFQKTSSTTKQQLSELESSSTSIEAGASASFWGAVSAGASVLSKEEQEQASSFDNLSSRFNSQSIGVTLPAGKTKEEIMLNWQKETLLSNGLALVNNLKFSRLDALLDTDVALGRVNKALANGTKSLQKEELDAVRDLLTKTIDGYCMLSPPAKEYNCAKPTPDQIQPVAANVTAEPTGDMFGYNWWNQQPFNGVRPSEIAKKFNQEKLTYDIRPTTIDSWWSTIGNDPTRLYLCALQTTYTNSKGTPVKTEMNGPYQTCVQDHAKQCIITVPHYALLQTYTVYSGNGETGIYGRMITGFSFKSADKEYVCGNKATPPHDVTLKGTDYWFGFTGTTVGQGKGDWPPGQYPGVINQLEMITASEKSW